MKAVIAAGEIELMVTPLAKWVWREELVAKAVELWPIEIIEQALGDDAARVLPDAIRMCELHARVPRYQVAMLEHFAERESTSVGAVLTRELEDIASAHFADLARAIPGFDAALAWPHTVAAQHAC
jgi:hypothetical protein